MSGAIKNEKNLSENKKETEASMDRKNIFNAMKKIEYVGIESHQYFFIVLYLYFLYMR